MAPARVHEEEDDPVTAEYDIYLTPAQQQQIYILQYPNRPRDRPYNTRNGMRPDHMRIKPESGYLEADLFINTGLNFNKYQSLKWGDSMRVAQDAAGQSEGVTHGLAGGLFPKGQREGGRGRGGVTVKDQADRELQLGNDINSFEDAEKEGKVMRTQTLGGQIQKHESAEEADKPTYFVGAFRGIELHLSQVTGTVQMRPQFHHLDAEEQRGRVGASRDHFPPPASAASGPAPDGAASSSKDAERGKLVHMSYRSSGGTANPKGELEEHSANMRAALQQASEEHWVTLDYVDEDDEDAYTTWNERMFVQDTGEANCPRLKSSMEDEDYLDALSAPGRESPTGRRKTRRRGGKKDPVDVEDDEVEGG